MLDSTPYSPISALGFSSRTVVSSLKSSSSTTAADNGGSFRLHVLGVSSNGQVECQLEIAPQKTVTFGFNFNEMNASDVAGKLVSRRYSYREECVGWSRLADARGASTRESFGPVLIYFPWWLCVFVVG